jgi:hypothetical protein
MKQKPTPPQVKALKALFLLTHPADDQGLRHEPVPVEQWSLNARTKRALLDREWVEVFREPRSTRTKARRPEPLVALTMKGLVTLLIVGLEKTT